MLKSAHSQSRQAQGLLLAQFSQTSLRREYYTSEKMKLKEFLEIVYDYSELSIFNTDSSEYVLHRVKKDEVIEKYPELLGREIDYVNVHWFDDTGATLGIVLL